MKKTINLILVLTLLIFSTSCSEDKNEPPTQKSFEELIIGEWSFVNKLVNEKEVPFPDPCHKEYEVLIFNKNKTFEQTEYEDPFGNGCEKTESTRGTWSIDNDNLKMSTTPLDVKIVTLNEDVLSLKITSKGNTVILNQKRKK